MLVPQLKHSSVLAVHPASKLSGGRGGTGVRSGRFVSWDDVVLDIGDEEKKIMLKTRAGGVSTEKV